MCSEIHSSVRLRLQKQYCCSQLQRSRAFSQLLLAPDDTGSFTSIARRSAKDVATCAAARRRDWVQIVRRDGRMTSTTTTTKRIAAGNLGKCQTNQLVLLASRSVHSTSVYGWNVHDAAVTSSGLRRRTHGVRSRVYTSMQVVTVDVCCQAGAEKIVLVNTAQYKYRRVAPTAHCHNRVWLHCRAQAAQPTSPYTTPTSAVCAVLASCQPSWEAREGGCVRAACCSWLAVRSRRYWLASIDCWCARIRGARCGLTDFAIRAAVLWRQAACHDWGTDQLLIDCSSAI